MGIPVKLTNVTICFPHLVEAHTPPMGQTPKYSVESLFSFNRQDLVGPLEEAFRKVLTDAGKEALIGSIERPWKDGNAENQKRLAKGKQPRSELTDHFMIRASSTERKPLVDQNAVPFVDDASAKAAVFGGCICHVHLDLYWSNNPVNPGVFCGLNGVQLVNNVGVDRLGAAGPSIDEMFGPVEGGTPPATPGAPPSWM